MTLHAKRKDVDSRWEQTAAGITETCYESPGCMEANAICRGVEHAVDRSRNMGHTSCLPL